jgi:hypothetical protein
VAERMEEVGQPKETANVVRPLDDASERSRALVDAVLVQVNKDRISDSRWYLGIFGIGFLTLAGLFISGYLLVAGRVETVGEKILPVDKAVTRIEQKLDDLIARLPPRK